MLRKLWEWIESLVVAFFLWVILSSIWEVLH
jgi:hypothetical protein